MPKWEIRDICDIIYDSSGDLMTFKKRIWKWFGMSVSIEIAPEDYPGLDYRIKMP